MAAINEAQINIAGVAPEIIDAIKAQLASFFWSWYEKNKDDRIFKKKILFWMVSVHVRDLYPLFMMLFGPAPQFVYNPPGF